MEPRKKSIAHPPRSPHADVEIVSHSQYLGDGCELLVHFECFHGGLVRKHKASLVRIRGMGAVSRWATVAWGHSPTGKIDSALEDLLTWPLRVAGTHGLILRAWARRENLTITAHPMDRGGKWCPLSPHSVWTYVKAIQAIPLLGPGRSETAPNVKARSPKLPQRLVEILTRETGPKTSGALARNRSSSPCDRQWG